MIETKKQLNEILNYEKKLYFQNKKCYWEYAISNEPFYQIWKYVKNLRKCEYYHSKYRKNQFWVLSWMHYRKKKNRLGMKLGIEIGDFAVGRGLLIWHAGSIVINGNSIIGENCHYLWSMLYQQ